MADNEKIEDAQQVELAIEFCGRDLLSPVSGCLTMAMMSEK